MKIHARLISRIVLAVSVIGISLVSGQAIAAFPSAPYFPLPVSAYWEYSVDSPTGIATVTRSSTSDLAGTIRLNTSFTITSDPLNGSRSYYTSDGSGIRLHRKYSPSQLVQGTLRTVIVTFNSPIVLANGTTDFGQPASPTSGTATLDIPGAGPFGSTVTCSLPYTEPQVFTVNSLESVDVLAGHFDNVLKLSGSVRIAGLCSGSAVDQTLALTLYLAQNIGPVKIVSTTTDSTVLTTETSTSELTGTNLPAFTLTVTKAGTGSGTVTSTPGISCGTDCSESYIHGTSVTLTAAATGGSTFAGWSGDCDTGGQVTLDADKTCTATFNPPPVTYVLNVSKFGTGSGTVTSDIAGINCGGDCSESYGEATSVTLTAAATGGSTFAGWGGDCAGTTSTCNLTMNSAKTATATFDPPPSFSLNVTATGSGTGSVTSSPGGINCPGTCSGNFGGSVILTATPTGGSTFVGWSGDCTGTTSTCNLTMDGAKTATATFNPPSNFSLNVIATGGGSGNVTSSVGGINCAVGNSGTCSTTIANGAGVTLTAAPTGGSTFVGWGGNCAGTATTCNLTMDSAKTVSATFTAPLPSYVLTVNKLGTGTGNVTSNPAGVSCGSDCSESYVSGTSITLTAAATGGSAFVGWGGVCAEFGASPICNFVINSAITVSATFNPPPPPGSYTLTVTKTGTGTGSVTSGPAGIDCGGTCSAPFTSGAIVTLTATPTGGATFAGWTGGCNSSGQVTLDADKTCTATFNPPSSFSLDVTATGSGSGNVTSSVGGISCGVGNSGTCLASLATGTPVTLTATPTGGSTFDGWGGDCASFGTGLTCTLTMDSAKTASAAFTAPPAAASPVMRTFLTTDVITVEHTYYDPNDACLGVPPVSLKLFAFTLEGQLVLGRNRDTTGGVTNTQIGTSKSWVLLATLDPGALPPGVYNLIFRVEPCTSTPEHQDVYVSEFYVIEVFAAP